VLRLTPLRSATVPRIAIIIIIIITTTTQQLWTRQGT